MSKSNYEFLEKLRWDKIQQIRNGDLVDVDDDGVFDFRFFSGATYDGGGETIQLRWTQPIVWGNKILLDKWTGISQTWIDNKFWNTARIIEESISLDTVFHSIKNDGREDIRFAINVNDDSGWEGSATLYASFMPPALAAQAPTYKLTLLPFFPYINEGEVFTATVSTTNVSTGTPLYYSLSGFGITAADFKSETLVGTGIIDSSGTFSFSQKLQKDLITEGYEQIEVKLYTDDGRTVSRALMGVYDTSKTLDPRYAIWTVSVINEGSTLTTSIATTDVASGTTLYYSLNGTGITAADFTSGALTGSGTVASNGSFSFSHTLANDLTTEGTETLNIKLFSDASRLQQVGSTASVTIADTSPTPTPTYTLTTSTSSINEGSTLTTSIATTNVASGTTLYYSLSGTGITTADFSAGALTGEGTTDATGKFSFSHTIANDLSTEGTETLNIKLFSNSTRSNQVGSTVSVSIVDTSFVTAPSKAWTKLLGGGSDDTAFSVSTASDGSIYIAGYTTGSIDGQSNNGDYDAFITKFNSDGSKVWTKLLGGGSVDIAQSVSTASDGSIYIAGYTYGSIDGQSNSGSTDAFITKFNSDGSKVWTKLLGGGSSDSAESVSTASDGSIYIAGYTGSSIDGQSSNGTRDAFITKLNSDGSKVWTKLLGGASNDYAYSVSTASDGSIYIAGYTNGSIDGQSNNGVDDAFITKFNSDGSKVWTKLLGGASGDNASSVSTASDGSIYIAGSTTSSIDGQSNNGVQDAFITKFNSDGSKVWTKLLGGGSSDSAESVSTASDGSIYIAGKTGGSIDGQSNNGGADAFITKLNSDGSKVWTKLLGGGSNDEAYSVSTASDGSIYIAGRTGGSIDGQSNNGYEDAFITKLNSDGSSGNTKTYTLTSSLATINEGAVLTNTVTTNVATGTKLYYSLIGTGITTADFSAGALTGEGVTDATGRFSFSHTLSNDLTTEGAETLNIKLFTDSARTLQVGSTATVSVVDSSITAPLVVRGNSLYTIVDGPSWTQAEANSVKLGGHLVSISSDSENKFLVDQYAFNSAGYNGDISYYLGLTDKASKGTWIWSDGSPLSFSNWSPGEPQQTSGEDYSEFLLVSTGPRNPGQWGDNFETIGSGKGISETAFIRRGDSAYVIVSGPTWEEAETNAVKLGGHLVTINDAAENEWLYDFILPQKPDNMMFIGMNDANDDGSYIWSSGETSTYLNWASGEPSRSSSAGEENYGFILASKSNDAQKYKWFDTTLNGNSGNVSIGIAEIKLAPNNIPTGTPTVTGTFKVGSTLTIDATTIQDSDNFTGYTPTFNYNWETSTDGTTWSKLTTTDGADNNNTYILTAAEASKKIRGVVSYLDGYGTNEVVNSAESIIEADTKKPIIRGNSLYTIVDGPSWTQAEANSVKLGGHLVTLNNAVEDAFVYANIAMPGYNAGETDFWFWIGARGKDSNTWWSSGENVEYSNWQEGEGTNDPYDSSVGYSGVYETYLQSSKWGSLRGINHSGNTSDVNPNGYNISGIAETTFIRRGDSAYVIVSGPTWEEAEANAVKLGGHLVTINDKEENEWLTQYYGKGKWIGINDKEKEGTFKWSSGEEIVYTNWAPGEPSNAGSIQDYGWIQFENGKWDDLQNDPGVFQGIAEIKLAPNNTPTGTPTVTGTFKVGSTLTIDATAIKDSDNFTGYTPTFKYNWEISNDGTTWSQLTTTDAVDNNNTYILTAAEANKKIRGVVSYLDGYGSNEVVNSVASSPITSSAPPVQSLTLNPPSKTAIRSGINTTSAITYTVSTGEINLTGVGASLYFDSTQLSVSIAGDPFKTGLLGNAITADTSNADGDPKTDKVLSLSYADFNGNFPGSGTTLPLVLANLNLVPTNTFSGSTLHLKGDPAVGFTATGADLLIALNAAPVVNGSIPALSTNRYTPFSYTLKSDLFSDPDSSITLSATTNTGDTLPSWLTFNPTTRTLSGTPTTGGTLNLNLSATDELGSVSTPLTLKIREVQSLSSATTPIRYQRNKELTVPINYSTSDGLSTTGLSFKVHFNSSLLSFDSTTGITNKTQADLFQIGATQQDTANTDNDATTDLFIPINIASFTGQFPTAGVPIKLADLIFKSLDKPIDPITGLKDTSINFSESEAASGYGFTATSASLKPLSFSLDVDRDGKVTALGDGLMIIRKLFGAAFAGDALINKAISPDSPYLNGIAYNTLTTQQKADVAAQVHANIQEGIDSKMLDVDKDSKTTALGDGLMVIRHLFGPAFAGAALTNKAISPDSPYFGPPANFAAVAANIDAMRPV